MGRFIIRRKNFFLQLDFVKKEENIMLFSSLFIVSPTQWNVDKCLQYYLKYLWHRMTGCEWTDRQRNIEAIPICLFFSSNAYMLELFGIIYVLTSCLICLSALKLKNDNQITKLENK